MDHEESRRVIWEAASKPWTREVLGNFYIYRMRRPTIHEMARIAGISLRSVSNWKAADRWDEKRNQIYGEPLTIEVKAMPVPGAGAKAVREESKARAQASNEAAIVRAQKFDEVEEQIRDVESMHIARDVLLADEVCRARADQLAIVKEMKTSCKQFFTGLCIDSFRGELGGAALINAATNLFGKAVEVERKTLKMQYLDNPAALRQWLVSQGYDLVRSKPGGGVERLGD